MRSIIVNALVLSLAKAVSGQDVSMQDSLSNALENIPNLSTFRGLLTSNPSFLGTIMPNNTIKVTVLVPDNDAFTKFTRQYGQLTTFPPEQLIATLKYHFLVSELRKDNLTVKGGITVPTLLQDVEYNNRSANAQLQAQFGDAPNGQVVFVSADPINPAKIKVRQSTQGVELRGGLGQGGHVTALDSQFSGGLFQSIDTILSPPNKCTVTVRGLSSSLSSLDRALNRTGLWSAVDASRNITCLAPNNAAFQAAGSPDEKLDTTNLTNALLFHTLPFPAYSNFLKDGQEIKSLANLTVRITVKDGNIFFNDAKLLSPNVLTNNGMVHVLDRVMSPLDSLSTSTSSSTPTATASQTSSATVSGTTSASATATRNAGLALDGSKAQAGLVAFVVAALLC